MHHGVSAARPLFERAPPRQFFIVSSMFRLVCARRCFYGAVLENEKKAILVEYHSSCRAKTKPDRQLLLAMAASLGYLTIGLVRGFSSPGVPSMQALNPELVPDEQAVSWVSAVPPLGAAIGSLAAGPLLQKFGRRRSLMVSAPVFTAAWIIISAARSTMVLVLARMFTGFCAGLVTPSAQLYVSECSHARIRGILGSLPALFMAGGVLISYVLGAYLSWHRLALASAVFPALLFIVLIPLPESPTWLLNHGQTNEAKTALRWLRRGTDVAAVELRLAPQTQVKPALPPPSLPTVPEITAGTGVTDTKLPAPTQANDTQPPQNQVIYNQRTGALTRREVLRRPVLIPFALSVALLVFQQVSGIDTIIFYTVEIFTAADSAMDEYIATILVGVVQLLSTLASLLFIDRLGRRPLLLLSGAVMGVAMTGLGVYFYLLQQGQAANLGLLPVASMLIFMIGFSVGYCNIPFLLMGELIPARQRSLLGSIAGSANLGAMFLVIKTYPDLKNLLGSYGTFWLYAVLCFASCAFVGVLLPETKGKTFEEIEHHFEKSHQDRKARKRAGENSETTNGGATNGAYVTKV